MPHADREAFREYHTAWRRKNHAKVLEYSRRYNEKNREKLRRNHRATQYRLRYGITIEQYEAMLASQGGCCAICRADKPCGKGHFHVDHDHATGRVRGILCHRCNTSLGYLERHAAGINKYLRGTLLVITGAV